jgi:hypothetical protein
MPDSLYERDVLAWSEHQADLLRRLGRGERVNDVDWTHVAEEIEDVGLSQLRAVERLISQIFLHLLKLYAWPDSQACGHWRSEIVGFQKNLKRRFAPSMSQRINIDELYGDAVAQMLAGDPGVRMPVQRAFNIEQLVNDDWDALLARLTTAPGR